MTPDARRRSLLGELGHFVRANLASVAATALDWLVVTALVWLRAHYLGAAAAGALAGAATDFALKRHWAFPGPHKGRVHHEALRYLAVSGASLLWNLAAAWTLVDGLGLPPVPGVILGSIAVGFAWNYPLHRLYVFRRRRPAAAGGRTGGGGVSAAWAVVCDFDGTATVDDLADALSIRFAGYERWKRANDAFQEGRIPFVQLLREIFEPIAATPEEVRAFALEHARFRPGFERLVRFCRERGYPFVLASGGLDIYIRPALEGLPAELTRGLDVRANRAEYLGGRGLSLAFPHQDAPGACGTCGSCKGAIVSELRARGLRVAAVGDGNADRCSARVADQVFARGRLLDWCRRTGLDCIPFETLDTVVERLASG